MIGIFVYSISQILCSLEGYILTFTSWKLWYNSISLIKLSRSERRIPDFYMQLGGCSWKEEDAYPTGIPGSCSQLLVESELLVYFSFISSNVLFWLFYIICYMRLFSLSSLYPWIILKSVGRILCLYNLFQHSTKISISYVINREPPNLS